MTRWPEDRHLVSWTWNLTALVFHLAVVNAVLITLWLTGGDFQLRHRLLGPHPLRSAGVGLAVGLGLAAAARLPPLLPMWTALVRRASPPSLAGRAVVALSGAVAEELLFRGVLQHLVGVAAATALFAASHVPTERALRLWPVTGLFTGVVLAWLHREYGGVIGPIVAHLCWELSGRLVIGATSTGSAR